MRFQIVNIYFLSKTILELILHGGYLCIYGSFNELDLLRDGSHLFLMGLVVNLLSHFYKHFFFRDAVVDLFFDKCISIDYTLFESKNIVLLHHFFLHFKLLVSDEVSLNDKLMLGNILLHVGHDCLDSLDVRFVFFE